MTSATVNGNTSNYVYDGDGNKVSQTFVSATTNYLVDSNNPTGYAQIFEEQDGSNTVNKVLTYGTMRISQDQLISGNWTLSFFGFDGQGSVRYLADATGTITDTYDYDAFGIRIHQTGTTPNEFFYDGEQFDPDLGQYYLRARYMNPAIGRFQNMDVYEGNDEYPLTFHKYIFTRNNPVNRHDSSGFSDDGGISNAPRVYTFDLTKFTAKSPTHIFLGETVLYQTAISRLFNSNQPWTSFFAHTYLLKMNYPDYSNHLVPTGAAGWVTEDATDFIEAYNVGGKLHSVGLAERAGIVGPRWYPSAQEIKIWGISADNLWDILQSQNQRYIQDSATYTNLGQTGYNSNSYTSTILSRSAVHISPGRPAPGWGHQLPNQYFTGAGSVVPHPPLAPDPYDPY